MLTCQTLVGVSLYAQRHTIKKTEKIEVEVAEGDVPLLPWQVLVTYKDHTREWRQVRWDLSTREDEERISDKTIFTAGSKYTVNGFIIGEAANSDGYPITARVKVVGGKSTQTAATPVAHTLPLVSVSLTDDNRLTSNRDLDLRAILSWDVSQQLYNYRDTYGLSTEGYPTSDGWDSPTTKLKGHGSGHYMSALALAYANTFGTDMGIQFRERIERMLRELRECQERTFLWCDSLGRYFEARDYAPEAVLKDMKGDWDAFDEYKKDYQHYGYGYLNAIPAAHPVLVEKYSPYNNEEWVWAPYYTIHKQLAGLIEIANVMDHVGEVPDDMGHRSTMTSKELSDLALLIAKDMGLWVWNRLHYRTFVDASGTKQERQSRPGNRYEMWNMYIAGEVGGMEESLARLSQMVTDKTEKERLLEAAGFFDAPAFFGPLSRNIDDIRNRHANQHIPMITGAMWMYRCSGNPYYYNIASNFWNMIQGRYMYAMGGVGNSEMFREPYTQMASMNSNEMQGRGGKVHNPDMNETCCAYNLAKLTKELNCYDPDNAQYMDYYERVLYNQIVGSLNPTIYSVTYHYAVGLNAIKPFGNRTPQETCCGGTGAENHLKYQEAAYFVNENTMWVALYLPSIAQWEEMGVEVRQECQWPAERSTITIKNPDRKSFSLKLRIPYWATDGFEILLNGVRIAKQFRPCSYAEIPARQWSEDDVVEVRMPFTKHICFGPDKMNDGISEPMWLGTIMYGPLVMSSTDIHEWKDAEFAIRADLSDIEEMGRQAGAANGEHIHTLRLKGKTFQPDYYQTHHSTHYLRLSVGH